MAPSIGRRMQKMDGRGCRVDFFGSEECRGWPVECCFRRPPPATVGERNCATALGVGGEVKDDRSRTRHPRSNGEV